MRFGDVALEKFCELVMQYFRSAKLYKIELVVGS